ncbi:cupin domain-containing protein [Belnapia sp. F-4-1]|uniref:cupin domain-containing protein n=1 Tax=Belnapia sp. F-4-1 TaxID=1545443 RepID=UPI0005BD7578|nr:cupin domain-containing protein [Belnapia sp. F-4-1]
MLRNSLLAAVATTVLAMSSAFAAGPGEAKVTKVYEHPLPNVPGKSLVGVLVEYGPGGSSAAHRHPSSAFIYATVLEGTIVSQVNDGAETVYRSGQNFSENPGDRHAVSRNASTTESAKLLAVFVVDTGERNLVLPY